MHKTLSAWVMLVLCLTTTGTGATTLDLGASHAGPVGRFVAVMPENHAPLTPYQAMAAREAGRYVISTERVITRGVGAAPQWLALDLHNPAGSAATRRLTLATSWIDRLAVYHVQGDQVIARYVLGDALAHDARPVDGRYLAVDLVVPPGDSSLYLRAATPDPMVLPLYLDDISDALTRDGRESLSYGLVYGGILTLLAYNLILFVSLRNRRYLYFVVYLGVFMLANAAYTGHGFQWLWPDAPGWQQWANPLLIAAYQLAGVLFATNFLRTAERFPRVHVAALTLGCGQLLGVVGALLAGERAVALWLSIGGVFVFASGLVLLGAAAVHDGNRAARYFLLASITHLSSAAVTAAVVTGVLPYSVLGYRAVEIGMLVDAVLLAMALADEFRTGQAQKTLAEHLARLDPLTGVNNRRAFREAIQPLWHTGRRRRQCMSLIVADIDHFKAINDTYGHAQGDRVLQAIAGVLAAGARERDVLARWGGEEFILFLDDTPLADAAAVAERMRAAVAALRVPLGDDRVAITASFGVAEAGSEEADMEELLARADRCLYRAKELGRNRVCSDDCEVVAA